MSSRSSKRQGRRRPFLPPIPADLRADAAEREGRHSPPTRRQLDTMRGWEKRLGWPERWAANKAEALLYLELLRTELARADARAEREANPDQWSLPAAETQLFELRRKGVEFKLPLTRREANDLLETTREPLRATG